MVVRLLPFALVGLLVVGFVTYLAHRYFDRRAQERAERRKREMELKEKEMEQVDDLVEMAEAERYELDEETE